LFINALGGLGREILLGDQNVSAEKAVAHGYVFKDMHIGPTMNAQLRGSVNDS